MNNITSVTPEVWDGEYSSISKFVDVSQFEESYHKKLLTGLEFTEKVYLPVLYNNIITLHSHDAAEQLAIYILHRQMMEYITVSTEDGVNFTFSLITATTSRVSMLQDNCGLLFR